MTDETIAVDGIEITIAPPEQTGDAQVAMKDYYVVTSPALPDGVSVAFYKALVSCYLATSRPGVASRHRRFRSLAEAREAAIKYVVNRAK